MRTFKAKQGTEFLFDPDLDGEIWITPAIGHTVVVPVDDLLEFSVHACETPEEQSEEEIEGLMKILDDCGVFDPRQSREASRARILKKMRGGGGG